jgi:hypothetical protein
VEVVERFRRWRGRRRVDLHRRLADDADRVAGAMLLVLIDAARLKVEVPDSITACSTVWRAWADRLRG